MKKVLMCVGLSLMFAGSARADELGDANALFQEKSYPQAMQLYERLAKAGNAEAQLHLGEMYWYGEAGAIDLVKAEALFRQSAAKGNKTAAAALEVMRQRGLRRADIDYWVSKYDGEDLRSGKFRCAAPRIPAISKLNEEITSVASSVDAWQECYNRFVANMNAYSPLSKRIPADISALLNQAELDAAQAHLEEVYQRIAADSSIGAKLVLADFAAWRSATETYVREHNDILKRTDGNERAKELEARKNNYVPASK